MIWRFQNHTGFTTQRGDRPLVPDGAPGEVKGSRDCHSDRGKVLLAYARYQAIWTFVRKSCISPHYANSCCTEKGQAGLGPVNLPLGHHCGPLTDRKICCDLFLKLARPRHKNPKPVQSFLIFHGGPGGGRGGSWNLARKEILGMWNTATRH